MIIDDRDRQSYSYISVVSLNITIIKSTFITGIPNYIQYTVVPWYPWGIISRTLNCGPQNIVFKKSLANSRLFKFSPVLSSRSFIVFVLQLCLWSILVWFLWKVKELCVYFFFLHVDVHLFQHRVLKRRSFLHWFAFALSSRICWLYLSISGLYFH